MSLCDYLLNPRQPPKDARPIFGDWMGETPVLMREGVGWSTVRLSRGWAREYRKLAVQYRGRDLYKKVER